jgi:hypothetical protein
MAPNSEGNRKIARNDGGTMPKPAMPVPPHGARGEFAIARVDRLAQPVVRTRE